MNKVIDKGFRSCRFVSTIVKHPVVLTDTGYFCITQATVERYYFTAIKKRRTSISMQT